MKLTKRKRKKYARLVVDLGYVVDPNNDEMVQNAHECIYEDLMNAYKYGDLYDCIKMVDSPGSTKKDIPQFLLEEDI